MNSSSSSERLPLLADLVLYYCRHAEQPVLVQLYQAEVRYTHTKTHLKRYKIVNGLISCSVFITQLTLVGGEKRKEVFIHSLELGHTAGTRAVKAMGESHTLKQHTQQINT